MNILVKWFNNLYFCQTSCGTKISQKFLSVCLSRQALQLYKADPAQVILEIINTIEGSPPVDVSAVRSM